MRCSLYNFSENNYLLTHDLQSTTDEYTYDAHGNMTSMPHLPEMLWDYKDNFKEATLDLSGNKVFYTYDAEGNRVRKVIVKGNIVEECFYIGDMNNIQAAASYANELQKALDYKSRKSLIELTKKGFYKKETYVKLAIQLETKSLITQLQFYSEHNLDYYVFEITDKEKDLISKIRKFEKKYLEKGELITQVKPEKSSRMEKKLNEINYLSNEIQTERFKEHYETYYDKVFKKN